MDLPRKIIDCMCPRQVCRVCGVARERVVETGALAPTEQARITAWDRGKLNTAEDTGGMAEALRAGGFIPNHERPRTTLGWTDCGCTWDDDGNETISNQWRPGIVYDPFVGSGTTLAAAQDLGRDAIGCDLDPRNADLARERVGMFLETEELERKVATVDVADRL
jgi:hypothetical protein